MNILTAAQFDREFLDDFWKKCDLWFVGCKSRYERNTDILCNGKYYPGLLFGYTMATLFFEPSTRTRLSFEKAMQSLGGDVLTVENANSSSSQKGESLSDTIKTLECYADCIVVRHPDANAVQNAAKYATKPIINAGEGRDEHPTQALIDLYTIKKTLGRLDCINVAFIGDTEHARTCNSFRTLLENYEDISFYRIHDVDPKKVDVVYVVRPQKEKWSFNDDSQSVLLELEHLSKDVLSENILNSLNDKAIILHPLPRNSELPTSVDSDPRAAYFKQVEYGVRVRAALLKMVLDRDI